MLLPAPLGDAVETGDSLSSSPKIGGKGNGQKEHSGPDRSRGYGVGIVSLWSMELALRTGGKRYGVEVYKA